MYSVLKTKKDFTTEGSNIYDAFGTNPIMYSPLQFPLNVEQSERGRSSVLLSLEMPLDKCWLYQNFSEGGDNVSC